MPEVKTDENRVVTGEVSGFARELKYERLGQIFDIIAKNRNMQDVWTQIFQTKAGAGVRSINTPDDQSKISKLVTQFRPVVIDELTKRLISFGGVTISGVVVKELIKKIINRFKS